MENTRKINITFEIPDNDLSEFQFERDIYNWYNVVSYKKLPDTTELYESNTHFRKLVKKYNDARIEKEKYINKHNH